MSRHLARFKTLDRSDSLKHELSPRLLLLSGAICVVAAAATPYIVLKLGMSVDLSFGGMFLAAFVLGRYAKNRKELAVQLNIIQTMINTVAGLAFMCVILAAFYYIKVVFGREIDFNPHWWQVSIWLFVSANLGVFVSAIPRRMILNDESLPWPTGQAVLSVAQTLSDPEAGETTARRRAVLTVATAVAGFLTFLRDALGVLPALVANPALALSFGLELAGFGSGMLIPLGVGLSGLVGVWLIATFGETVGQLAALSGTAAENWDTCRAALAAGTNSEFLTNNCGRASDYLAAGSHFKWVVQWNMWPATAMMIAAALTSVLLPLVKNTLVRTKTELASQTVADEHIPSTWIWGGIAINVAALVWIQDAWFGMPWYQVAIAILIQPVLIVAGLRVLGLTGQGPVSLMANATQLLFGLAFPGHIKNNLMAAHVSADPQASSEASLVAFWVSRRVGGRFSTLIAAQVIALPIGAILLPITFNLLQRTYGIGLEPGQLSAPTGLKIATLAVVMEKGVSALPPYALEASVVSVIFGCLVELLLFLRRTDAQGQSQQRFPWLPVPSALGFALILPPSLTISMAVGSVISASWRRFSQSNAGNYALYAAPLAAGLIAGEAMVGAILLPVLGVLLEVLRPLLP